MKKRKANNTEDMLALGSMFCFLIAGAAGEDSYGIALLLVILSGVCMMLSAKLQKGKKAKKCIRRQEKRMATPAGVLRSL